MKKWKMAGLIITLLFMMTACSVRVGSEGKVRDLDFTVLAEEEVPEEFMEFILDKQEQAFRFTYTSGEYLYIAVGYGQQESGGYSISVSDFFLTENSIILDTELIGPSVSEDLVMAPSYPFIVIKTEKIEQPVMFR